MAESLREAVRERLRRESVASWLLVVGVLYWALGSSPVQLGTSLATGVAIGVGDLLIDVYDLHPEVRSFAMGVVGLLSGAALLTVSDSIHPFIGMFLLTGMWMVFDAVQMIRHEGLYADDSSARDGHEVYQEYVTRKVDETLRERPRTRMELYEEVDFEASAIDDALATLDEHDLLSREGSELRTSRTPNGEQSGRLVRIRQVLGRFARRLVRPITIELQRPSTDG